MSHQQELLLKGRSFYRQGDMALAISSFLAGIEESLAADENEAIYWIELAHLFRETGQSERALALNQYGLQLAEDDDYLLCAARLGLAADLWVLNKQASALSMMQQALANPALYECAYLLERLSQLYTLQEEWLLALGLVEKAIVLYQGDPAAMASCGLALLKLQAKAKVCSGLLDGLAIVKEYMHLLPNAQREMQIELGRAYQAAGQFAESATHFMNALQISAKAQKKTRPRRLAAVEYKLRHMTSEIEIELLREKNVAQHQQVQELENVTFRDELTGLHNARYLEVCWPSLLDQARDEIPLCLLSLGIDQFASIREVFGSELAYIAYHQVARILQSHLPAKAVLVCKGLGSFSLALLALEKAQIEQFAAQVQQDLARLESTHLPQPLSISMGGAFFQTGDTAEILQLRADLALFLGQRQGLGPLFWDEETR
jgi:diguanylate cyclase (GGDEF)-like protein